jgi:hypothetical protein
LRELSDGDPAGYVAGCGALAGFDARERLDDIAVPAGMSNWTASLTSTRPRPQSRSPH